MESKKRSRAQFATTHAPITSKKPDKKIASKKTQELTFDEIEKAIIKDGNSSIKVHVLNQKRVRLSPNFYATEQISKAKSKVRMADTQSKARQPEII